MAIYGIFNDEGLIEGDFPSLAAAEKLIASAYSPDEHAAECCHDHPEHEAATCEECNADDEADHADYGNDSEAGRGSEG